MIICQSARLTLRLLDAQADAPFILRLLNEPSFLENIGDRGVRSVADARRFIEAGPLAMFAQHGIGLFAVEMKDSHEAVGMCGLLRRDWLDAPDLGYAFLPEFWARGFAFESATAVLAWGREHRDLTRIVAITRPHNVGSQRVLEKLGMKFSRPVSSPEGQESHLYTMD